MRAVLLVLDSAGVGHAPDAAVYGGEGANTLGHIFEKVPGLSLPTLDSLGLQSILSGDFRQAQDSGIGIMQEESAGKDSTTGHWEIAGVVTETPFATFDHFPDELIRPIEQDAGGVRFIGNRAASGTAIIEELGPEHLRTGALILYTSADSVLQIAAHEEICPPEELHRICRVARRHADFWRIGRVIARPFVGSPGSFQRTANRHDYSMVPPHTVLNAISESGLPVVTVGKVSDIFAGSGITESIPTRSNSHGMEVTATRWQTLDQGLLVVNLVDFDTVYGHRRNVEGYAKALSEFDTWLGRFLPMVEPEDLLIITADHGNDPTWSGTDHTRERVPLFVKNVKVRAPLGLRKSFADIAATLAEYFALSRPWPIGKSFLA